MKTKDTVKPEQRITVRLSQETWEALKRLAKLHKRSLNSEVDWGLQIYIASEEKKQ